MIEKQPSGIGLYRRNAGAHFLWIPHAGTRQNYRYVSKTVSFRKLRRWTEVSADIVVDPMEKKIFSVNFFRQKTGVFVIHPVCSDNDRFGPIPIFIFKIFSWNTGLGYSRSGDTVVGGVIHIDSVAYSSQPRVFTAGISPRHKLAFKMFPGNIYRVLGHKRNLHRALAFGIADNGCVVLRHSPVENGHFAVYLNSGRVENGFGFPRFWFARQKQSSGSQASETDFYVRESDWFQ